MLPYSSRTHTDDDDFEFIHNYYEKHVLAEITQQSARAQHGDREFIADTACVALNHLPPRYIRYDVDMTFFMSPQEMREIEVKVHDAVKAAIAYVESRERNDEVEALPPMAPVISEPSDDAEIKQESTKTKKAPNKKNKK